MEKLEFFPSGVLHSETLIFDPELSCDDPATFFSHRGCLTPDIFLSSFYISSMRKEWSSLNKGAVSLSDIGWFCVVSLYVSV